MKIAIYAIVSLTTICLVMGWLFVPLAARAQANTVHIDKTANQSFTNPDTTVEYTVTITNDGEIPLQNIVVTENWPTTFLVDGQPGGFLTWSIDFLATGATATKTIKVTVPADTKAGSYDSTTTLISQQPQLQLSRSDKLDVRAVTVLSQELPTTGGDPLLLITLALIINCSLIAAYSFNHAIYPRS